MNSLTGLTDRLIIIIKASNVFLSTQPLKLLWQVYLVYCIVLLLCMYAFEGVIYIRWRVGSK